MRISFSVINRRICLIFCCLLTLFAAFPAPVRAAAQTVLPVPAAVSSDAYLSYDEDYYLTHPDEDPLFTAEEEPQLVPDSSETMSLSAADYSYVRIRLSTAGSALSVTLNGCYSLRNATDAICALPDYGSTYSFSASGGNVSVFWGNMPLCSGAYFILREHRPIAGTSGNAFSLSNSAYGTRSYRGDLIVYAEGSTLVFVNRVYIEDYLCGVVGNEIGDQSKPEALKAQAVAARSYAVSCISPSKPYDMLDTSANQTYKGICSDHPNSAAAVAATAKQLIMKNGALVPGFYSSSNGGEKETSRNRWGGPLSWANECVMFDEADLRYGINYAAQNNSNRYYEEAVFPANGTKTANTTALIRRSLLPLLIGGGLCSASATPADVILSGLYMGYTPMDEVDPVTCLSALHVRYIGFVSGTPFDVTATIDYRSFYVAQGWGLFSNGDLNRYWIVFDGSNYILRHMRRGHGVGLSQAGARRRALDGKAYTDILSFYYDGAAPVQSALITDKVLSSRTFALPKGDVYVDEKIDINDVITLCRYIACLDTLNSTQLYNADVDLDGAVSLADAIAVCRYLAGLL